MINNQSSFSASKKLVKTNQELLLNHGLWIIYQQSQQMCYPDYFSIHYNCEAPIREISKNLSFLFQCSGLATEIYSKQEQAYFQKFTQTLLSLFTAEQYFPRILQYIELHKHSSLTECYEYTLIIDQKLQTLADILAKQQNVSLEQQKGFKNIKESKLIKIIFETLSQNWKSIAQNQLMSMEDYIAFSNIYVRTLSLEPCQLYNDQKEIKKLIIHCYQNLQPYLPQLFDRRKEIAFSSKKAVILTEILKILLYQLNLNSIIFPDILNNLRFKTNYQDSNTQFREIICIADISLIKEILNSPQMKCFSNILQLPSELFDEKIMRQYEQFYLEYVQFHFLYIHDVQFDDLMKQQILLIKKNWTDYKKQIIFVFEELFKKKLIEQFVPIYNESSFINSAIQKKYEKNHNNYMQIVTLLKELKQLVNQHLNPQLELPEQVAKQEFEIDSDCESQVAEQLKQYIYTMISNVSTRTLEIFFKAFIHEMSLKGSPYIRLFTLVTFQKWNQKLKIKCLKSQVTDYLSSKLFVEFLNQKFKRQEPISIQEMKNILAQCRLPQMVNWPYQLISQMRIILKQKDSLHIPLLRLNKNSNFQKFVTEIQTCQSEDIFKMDLKRAVNDLVAYIQTLQ